MAKAARALPGDPVEADQVLDGRRAPRADASLLLVPTTAGTGSEVTQFATLYRKRRKVSLDADGVRADIALVDPALTDSCPPELTWTCAFDALAHTVESLWSTRSTAESRNYAEAALSLISPVLHDSRPTPSSLDRDRLSQGATLAGHAIDITRTTAAHAFAYPLTIHFGVPHGLACALNLTWLATAVEQATSHEIVGEPEAMTRAVNVLRRALCTDERDLGAAIRDLIAARGLAVRWPTTDASDLIDLVLAEGAASNRISGTPVAFDSTRVRAALQALLTDHGARKEQSDA
jgi:alcohol dehydrogenase